MLNNCFQNNVDYNKSETLFEDKNKLTCLDRNNSCFPSRVLFDSRFTRSVFTEIRHKTNPLHTSFTCFKKHL